MAASRDRDNRNFPLPHFYLAAALAHSVDSMRRGPPLKTGLALIPDFTLRRFRAVAPSDNPMFLAGRERIYDGMRKAGVPEG